MGILNNLNPLGPGRHESIEHTGDYSGDHEVITASHSKGKEINGVAVDSEAGSENLDLPDADAQRGVQKIEAVTATWSKWALAALLFK